MNEYKINLHCHTVFSDGNNTPVVMASEAVRLGFSSLVITDHYYGPEHPEYSLSLDRYELLRRSCREAKELLPVIIGMEVPFMGQEILVFGSSAIKQILAENERPSKETLLAMKENNDCAFILCHPGDDDFWPEIKEVIDGFEHYNSGQNWFKHRGFGILEDLPRWCNSDAHHVDGLEKGFNIINSKIIHEADLIRYIKKGIQPEFGGTSVVG